MTDAEYADSLMGILVVQDIQLGALIAMMPLLCLQSYNSKALDELLKGGFILCSTLILLMLMCRLMSLLVIDRLFRFVWNYIIFCVCVHLYRGVYWNTWYFQSHENCKNFNLSNIYYYIYGINSSPFINQLVIIYCLILTNGTP